MNNLFIKISETQFAKVPQEFRQFFEVLTAEPDDDELFAGDEQYRKLISTSRKASKELRDYKFDKRHK
jgi:hypothetical protein